MSVPDHELDPDDRSCRGCERPIAYGQHCEDCLRDLEDLFAEMRFQDRYEGRGT